MADEPNVAGSTGGQKPRSSGRLSWLWMILAVVVMVGFLTWLGMESEPTSVAVVEEEEPEEDMLGITVVSKDTVATRGKAPFEGQRIQIRDVPATGALGDAIFWGELGDPANQVPLLVRLDSIAGEDFELQLDTSYTVTGALYPMSDSLAGAWLEAGELEGEGEQMQAAFADYYLQADRIRPVRESDFESDSDDGDDDGDEGDDGDGDDEGAGQAETEGAAQG
ncbi:MAG: hypothetical protein ACOC5I_02105 [Gemmatimonadota bacterium]